MTNTFIGPVILIFFGGVFLLNNLEILSWDVWLSLWKFWPAILILIGVEILLGKKASVKTLVILAGLIFLVPIILSYNPLTNNPLNTDEIKIEETLGTATKARINLNFPTSNIKIKSLETDSNFLAQGKITFSEASKKPEVIKEEEFGVVTLTMTQAFKGKLPFISNLRTTTEFSLSSVVPIEIFVRTGASNVEFDFSNLKVNYLEIDSGASSITVKFAENFTQKALIKTGASSITLDIPESIETKVIIDSQVKSVESSDRYEKSDNNYTTSGYDKAKIKISIEVKMGAGSVVIK